MSYLTGGTLSTDLLFNPLVWRDYIAAYYSQKVLWAALGFKDYSLTATPGTTITFPFFKQIGDMETPSETGALTPDSAGDDKFSATVTEVGKAVGFKDKTLMSAGTSVEKMLENAQIQMAERAVRKVDKDIVTELSVNGNSVAGFATASGSAGDGTRCSLDVIHRAKIKAFGERADEAVAMVMHSRQYADLVSPGGSATNLLSAQQAGGLFAGVTGHVGYLLGMAVLISDLCPFDAAGSTNAGASSTEARATAFILKSNAFGVLYKKDFSDMEKDRDILTRETVMSMTAWYAVKCFHAKAATDDLRVATVRTALSTL